MEVDCTAGRFPGAHLEIRRVELPVRGQTRRPADADHRPTPAPAAQFAASITYPLSDDDTNAGALLGTNGRLVSSLGERVGMRVGA